MSTTKTAKTLIESLPRSARVIEIAGPTPPGNEFLQRHHIHLAPKPLVTNRENPALFYGLPPYPKKFPVDEIANIHHLTYRSVDMFLCSYLTWFNDRRYDKKSLLKRWLATAHYKLRYTYSHANPHISLFRETAKALKPGGLLLVEGTYDADFPIAKKCGFRVVHRDVGDDEAALFLKK